MFIKVLGRLIVSFTRLVKYSQKIEEEKREEEESKGKMKERKGSDIPHHLEHASILPLLDSWL